MNTSKRKRKTGRPTKLNAATTEKVCKAIVAGTTYEAAAQYAGIGYSTFAVWMTGKDAPFVEFQEAIAQANASAQVNFARNIQSAAKQGDWRAAAWMLERRFPKAYGQRIGAIDEKSLDDAIESELARIAAARQTAAAGETASDAPGPENNPVA